jgi:hypothetical protein
MFLLGVPLLIFPFAIYNILAFLMPGVSLTREIWHVQLATGGEFGLTGGDLLVLGALLILLIEMVKSARMSRRTVVDHLLSMLLFVGMTVEFLMVKEVTSTTFLLLLAISFVDVIGGFAVSMRAARRNVSVTEVDHVHSH